jgi:Ser/Thr protein kinase RdoA (MazF antagonist)
MPGTDDIQAPLAADIPQGLMESLADSIGSFRVLASYRDGSVRTQVWKVGAASGDYYLKLHAEKRKWHPEVFAYRHWVQANAPYVPELVAVFEEEDYQGILITALKGRPLREIDLPSEQACAVYRQVGQLARQMHDQAPGTWLGVPRADGAPLADAWGDPAAYMAAEFSCWCGKVVQPGGGLDDRELALAQWALDHLDVFGGERPVPIDRDCMPKNWLVDGNGLLSGLIDFECMRWGLRIEAFFILWSKYFRQTPGSESAFFTGYGRDLVKERPDQFRIFKIYMGLCSIEYGRQVADEDMVRRGHRMLYEADHDAVRRQPS